MATDPPATLAACLRTRSDEQLGALLTARPDVARPVPSDVVALASRLAVPVSVDRALDELDAATLQVLDVVLLAPTDGVAPDELFAALPGLPDDVLESAVSRLTSRALLWGDDVLRAPDPVRRAVRHPAGLGRRAVDLRVQLPPELTATVAELPPEERAVLERLAADRPVGHLPDTPADGGGSPARRLLSRGLLARIDALNVELPRELGLLLRGDLPYGPPRLRPEPGVTTADPGSVDRRAGRAGLEAGGGGGGPARHWSPWGASVSCSGCWRRSRPVCCAAAASASATRNGWPAPSTSASRMRPGCSSWRRPPVGSPSADHTATSGCPRGPTTSGASRTWPTAGPSWPRAGWARSGCRRWSASVTSGARR